MQPAGHLRGLGDISSIVSELQQYGSDQILAAYTSLYQTYQSENQDLVRQTQWLRDNGASLTDAGKQLYISALNDQTDVVNNLAGWVGNAQAVIQAMGIQGAPGLSGLRRRGMGRLGVFPVIAAGVILAIIVLIAGVTIVTYEYYQNKSVQAHASIVQAQSMVQQQASQQVLDLVRTGQMTPQQAQAYMASLTAAQNQANQTPFLQNIPWTTIAVVAGAALVARAMFG